MSNQANLTRMIRCAEKVLRIVEEVSVLLCGVGNSLEPVLPSISGRPDEVLGQGG